MKILDGGAMEKERSSHEVGQGTIKSAANSSGSASTKVSKIGLDVTDDIQNEELDRTESEHENGATGTASVQNDGLKFENDKLKFKCGQPCLSTNDIKSEVHSPPEAMTQMTIILESKDSIKMVKNGSLCKTGLESPKMDTHLPNFDYESYQAKPVSKDMKENKLSSDFHLATELQPTIQDSKRIELEDSKIMYITDNDQIKLQNSELNLGQSELQIATAKENNTATLSLKRNHESMCQHNELHSKQPILEIASPKPAHLTSMNKNRSKFQNGKLKSQRHELEIATVTLDNPKPIAELCNEVELQNGQLKLRRPELRFNTIVQYDIPATSTMHNDEIKVNPEHCEHNGAGTNGRKQHVMDGGWAWMVLLAGALNHLIGDGIVSSLGIFIVVWKEQFPGSLSSLSWILSLILGVAYIAGPLGSALCKSFSIRQVAMGGTILSSVSFIAASRATSLWHLYVTFSTAGLGLALTIQPTSVVITYYFDKLLARANGISFSGVGVGVFILPPLFQFLIDNYGWQGALLVIAGLLGNMGLCAALYRPCPLEIESQKVVTLSDSNMDPSTDDESTSSKRLSKCSCASNILTNISSSFDFKLLKDINFSFLMAANFLYGFSYVIVLMYLPARAVHAGISHLRSAMLVSVIGISSFISRITHGYIIDYQLMTATILTAISFFMCSICCIVNPVTDTYEGLMILSVLVGLSSGVFNSTIPIVAKEYVGLQRVSGGVGLIHLTIGSGVMFGSYKAGLMFDLTGSYDIPFYVAGSCFMMCFLLIIANPVFKYFKKNTEDDDAIVQPLPVSELIGQDNIAVEIDC